ncbi:YqaJ viral recombinase family protein [Streptomyces sp. DH12]|uniref:YqaJ viral recombinase family nuclease n=1 Tax=Streptomyces sp. DH12 TaxID=2857010 RepID=UPI001E636ACF|nr:YqaJ viral recombinase family protein [Streptomyces sp. DH12]
MADTLAIALPAEGGHPDAPTARLILPADAPEEQWHAVRRAGLGGSNIAALYGLDKRHGARRVYEEKNGYREPDNTYTKWGRRLEASIAEGFEEDYGLATRKPPGTFAHIEHPWAIANVDRFVLDADGRAVAPLECKNKSEYLSGEWEGDEPPDGPALQAHWYMAVGGWSHAYVAGLIGGNRLQVFRLERDEELIEELFRYCGDWYQRHVVEGLPPAVDGLEATTELLARLWEVQPAEVVEVDLGKARDLRARRAALCEQIEALEAELNAVENEMRDAAGAGEIVKAGGRPAWSWKQNGNFAPSRFRTEQPELAAKYTRLVEAIDTDRLKEDHPKIYRQYRARVLRVPAKEL